MGRLRLPRLGGMELRLLIGMLLRVSSPASRCSLQAAGMESSAAVSKECGCRELR
jgi:hypothetical protein